MYKFILLLFFSLLVNRSDASENFQSMKQAIVVGQYFDKFDILNTECSSLLSKNLGRVDNLRLHVERLKNSCSAIRLNSVPIPEDIPVDTYKIIKNGRECLIQLANVFVQSIDARIRIDAITTLSETEKQSLRAQLGSPINDASQKCQSPLKHADSVRNAARNANGKRAFD